MHPFVKLAGLKSEQDFYKKYQSEDDFFKEYPLARNGYSWQQQEPPNYALSPEDYQNINLQNYQAPVAQPQYINTQTANNVQPISGASDRPVLQARANPNTTTTSPPQQSSGQEQTASNTSGMIQQVANTATSIVDGIGSTWRNIQVAAPQLLNSLIPDNNNRRTRTPDIGYNQYAYGTGSQMMYENGGVMGDYEIDGEYELSAEEIQRLKQLGYEVEIK